MEITRYLHFSCFQDVNLDLVQEYHGVSEETPRQWIPDCVPEIPLKCDLPHLSDSFGGHYPLPRRPRLKKGCPEEPIM